MSTRAFIVLIVAAMLFGGALAGAFIGVPSSERAGPRPGRKMESS